MNQSNELEFESIGKLLLKFSIPAIIGMLVNALYAIVDRIFVGRGVGSTALSGVAVTLPITNIIMAVGMLVGIGAAAVVSIKLGQKNKAQAEKILGNAFTLIILLSLLVTILGIAFLDPILIAFGASTETMPYAKQFGFILLLGVVLQNIGFGMNALIRSEGNPKIAMLTMLIGAVLNTIMNPLLIFGFHLGVVGSALATIISQAVCSIWVIMYFTKGKSLLKLKKENMKLEMSLIKEIIAIGMSPFSMQVAASLVTVFFNTSLAKYGGDDAIGAFALITSILLLILMPVFGINQGSQPIIGYNYGAKNADRVKTALLYASIAATSICVVGFIFVELFPVQIIQVFNTSDPNLTTIGSNGMKIFLLMLSVVGVQAICANYFQAIGKAKNSMFLALLRQVVLLIPLILILPHFFGLNGIWMAGPISDFLAFIITLAFVFKDMKNLNTLKEDDDSDDDSDLSNEALA
ncbi:MAG: MATE family efflux transporter [Clostridiaceae bacterium]